MTSLLMDSVVDGSIVALGIMITVVLLISGLATSEPRSFAKVKRVRILSRKPSSRG